MPRKVHLDAPGSLHHIICREVDRRRLNPLRANLTMSMAEVDHYEFLGHGSSSGSINECCTWVVITFRKFLPELSWRHDCKSRNHADRQYLLISGKGHIYSTADGGRQDAKVVLALEFDRRRVDGCTKNCILPHQSNKTIDQ